jgi:hypothetical protein
MCEITWGSYWCPVKMCSDGSNTDGASELVLDTLKFFQTEKVFNNNNDLHRDTIGGIFSLSLPQRN